VKLSTWNKLFIVIAAAWMLSACSTPFWSRHSGPAPGEEAQQPPAEQVQYKKADRPPPDVPRLAERCVEAGGQKVCGYDCKVSGDMARCAENPKQRCIVGPLGKIVCGYDCKVTGSHAACGKYLYDNCVTNMMGEIRCGNNCREREDGELVCGK